MSARSQNFGMTLIELLICLSIIGIVYCMALPLTPKLYKQNQIQLIEDQIKYAIRFAKIQSIIRRERLILTPIDGALDWSLGMALYVEKTSHQKFLKHGKLLHVWQWPSSGVHIMWQGFQSKDYLYFDPELIHSAINGVFSIDSGQDTIKRLVVNRIGRIYLAQ